MEVIEAINEARLSRFHSKAIFVSGMGFFTDAYDLFIIGVASTLLAKQWHLSATQTGLINSMTLLGAFLGACVLGRLADLLGRKRIAVFDASMMLVFALASAVAPSFIFLVGFRFLLGLGVGGDYPVSAVLMSEYANRKDRGRLVGLVFAMQALGTVAGYIAGLVLISAGVDHGAGVADPARPRCGALGAGALRPAADAGVAAVFGLGEGRRPQRRRRRASLLGRQGRRHGYGPSRRADQPQAVFV